MLLEVPPSRAGTVSKKVLCTFRFRSKASSVARRIISGCSDRLKYVSVAPTSSKTKFSPLIRMKWLTPNLPAARSLKTFSWARYRSNHGWLGSIRSESNSDQSSSSGATIDEIQPVSGCAMNCTSPPSSPP
jgi:hypothetical protein